MCDVGGVRFPLPGPQAPPQQCPWGPSEDVRIGLILCRAAGDSSLPPNSQVNLDERLNVTEHDSTWPGACWRTRCHDTPFGTQSGHTELLAGTSKRAPASSQSPAGASHGGPCVWQPRAVWPPRHSGHAQSCDHRLLRERSQPLEVTPSTVVLRDHKLRPFPFLPRSEPTEKWIEDFKTLVFLG